MKSSLLSLLQIATPVIQAPMAGGGDTVELVAAVSNAGALGSVGCAYLSPEQILERGRAIRAATSQPFGINLFAPMPQPDVREDMVQRAMAAVRPFYEELKVPLPETFSTSAANFDDQLAACMETEASVFSFTFGLLPPKAVKEIKKRKMVLMGTATTVDEAKQLVELGVDAVVAQGSEAGGHRGSFEAEFAEGMVGTMALLPQICDAVNVPVVASGGIMDGRGIAAAIVLGASAVQLGTAFLTCKEAGVCEAYKEAILSSGEDQTRITRAFSGRPARGIANKFLRALATHEENVLPFPAQNGLTRPLRTEATRQNRAEYLSLWAGQGMRMARRSSAADLVARLQRETDEAIRALVDPSLK